MVLVRKNYRFPLSDLSPVLLPPLPSIPSFPFLHHSQLGQNKVASSGPLNRWGGSELMPFDASNPFAMQMGNLGAMQMGNLGGMQALTNSGAFRILRQLGMNEVRVRVSVCALSAHLT